MENHNPSVTLKERCIELGYIIGLSLILAAIIYFFAANWAGLDKWAKIGLIIGLIVFFYGSAFFFSAFLKHRPLMNKLLLFAGCISFGVGLALLDQIYHSHADHFMLYLIWAIPSFLFSILTRFQPFYLLAYVLAHLSILLFVFPSLGFSLDDISFKGFLIGTAIVNYVLFIFIEKKLVRSHPLSFLSFVVFHTLMLILSASDGMEQFSIIMSIIYAMILGYFFVYDNKNEVHRWRTLISGIAAVIFFTMKFMIFLGEVGSNHVFLFTIFLPVILVGAAVWGLSWWGRRFKSKENTWVKRIFVGVIAGIASMIGAISIAGILFLILGNVSATSAVILATAALIAPAIFLRWNSVIRHTLLLTGYMIGSPSAILSGGMTSILFIVVLAATLWMYPSKSMKSITYFTFMLTALFALLHAGVDMEVTILTLLIFNTVLFLLSRYVRSDLKHMIYSNSYVYGFLAFFILTFQYKQFPGVYFTVNVLYFGGVTFLIFYTLTRHRSFEYRTALLFWFAYMIYKYYDLVWSLLHKSLTFLVIGVALLFITRWFDRFNHSENKQKRFIFTKQKWLYIFAIVVLQLTWISVQISNSEAHLISGETILLKLQPVDPRSLLQGDYIELNYEISDLDLTPQPQLNEKISIGLNKNKLGIYEYSGFFVHGAATKAPQIDQVDLWITGRYKGGGRMEYGIENFFISEGSGENWERTAKYAEVVVSKSGDAMLLSIK